MRIELKDSFEDPLFVALTFEEVLEETGRAPSTIRRWVRDGKLRVYVLDGQKVFIRRDVLAVEAWTAKRRGRPGARPRTTLREEEPRAGIPRPAARRTPPAHIQPAAPLHGEVPSG